MKITRAAFIAYCLVSIFLFAVGLSLGEQVGAAKQQMADTPAPLTADDRAIP